MAITFVNAGAFTEKAAGVTTVDLPYPASLAANDILILLWMVNGTVAPGTQTGFTTVQTQSGTAGTAAPGLSQHRKLATGSESGNFTATVNTAAGSGQILAFRGVDTTNPVEAFNWVDKTTTVDALIVLPSLTTAQVGDCFVYIAGNNSATGGSTPPSAPATFTETGDRIAGRNYSTGYLIWSGSGASGTMTVTCTGTTKGAGMVLALKPAATALPPRNVYQTDQATTQTATW